MSAVKELYYGNIGSHESIKPSAAWKKASDVEYAQNDKLEAMLTKEQNTEFDKFKDFSAILKTINTNLNSQNRLVSLQNLS